MLVREHPRVLRSPRLLAARRGPLAVGCDVRGSIDALLTRIFDAHGGRSRWARFSQVEAELSAHGFLFTLTQHAPLGRVRVVASTVEPRLTLFHPDGTRGECVADASVERFDAQGQRLGRRQSPRAAFGELRHQLRWDDLDFLSFAGYALWNSLNAPWLFARPGLVVERLPPSGGADRLRVAFPSDVPTHARTQTFWFNPAGDLVPHDCTTDVLGAWATAAHLCGEYRDFDGLRFATRRRVQPRLLGSPPFPWPTMVALEVHALRGR